VHQGCFGSGSDDESAHGTVTMGVVVLVMTVTMVKMAMTHNVVVAIISVIIMMPV